MTKHVARELTNQVTELTADEMEHVSGGGSLLIGHNEQILAHFHPITSVQTSMLYRHPAKSKKP
jgi:hypothetical protein